MFGTAFGTIMTVILVLYALYYAYNIIKDLYFDKSGDTVEEVTIDEKEVDITDELKDFTKYDANEDETAAKARKEAEGDAAQLEEDGFAVAQPLTDEERKAMEEHGTQHHEDDERYAPKSDDASPDNDDYEPQNSEKNDADTENLPDESEIDDSAESDAEENNGYENGNSRDEAEEHLRNNESVEKQDSVETQPQETEDNGSTSEQEYNSNNASEADDPNINGTADTESESEKDPVANMDDEAGLSPDEAGDTANNDDSGQKETETVDKTDTADSVDMESESKEAPVDTIEGETVPDDEDSEETAGNIDSADEASNTSEKMILTGSNENILDEDISLSPEDDTEFAHVKETIKIFQEMSMLSSEPAMTGAIEADVWETQDEENFKRLGYAYHEMVDAA